jgi:hypothetical protein
MGSVSLTNSTLTNLLQTLNAASPELSSMLSTPQMQSALGKASQGDLVQLSDQALQLQEVGFMFGTTDGTQSVSPNSLSDSLFPSLSSDSSTQPDLLLQALDSSLGVTGANGTTSASTGSTSTASSLADQIANNASSLQAQALDALFGTSQPAAPSLNTLG